MTYSSTLSLALAMLILAATPGPGLLLVSSQTAAHNLKAGFFTTFGIICADIFFIIVVTFGLAALTKHMQLLVPVINLFGGFYLIYIGIQTLKLAKKKLTLENDFTIQHDKQNISGFILSGFLITLSNPKAILFYLSFLPAFVDLTQLVVIDVMIIIAVAIFSISPTMLLCAWLTQKAKRYPQKNSGQSLFISVSAYLIIALGIYMLYRSLTLLTAL